MNEPKRLDKRNMLVQLESYILILEVNSELFEINPHVKEQIMHRIGMLGTHLDELDMRERMKDQINYNDLADLANRILAEIKSLLQQVLNQDSLPYNDSSRLVEDLRGAPLAGDPDKFFDRSSP